MTQDKAWKAAVRARMAETGERYTEAARQPPSTTSTHNLAAGTGQAQASRPVAAPRHVRRRWAPGP